VPTSSAAARQTWVSREPRLSPDHDRTGLQPPRHTVLVVDDDRGVLRLTARILRLEGYTVLEASSGAEALRLLDTEPDIRLVVTDVVMPGMHGLDLTTRILERDPRPLVVLMTGHAAELSPQLERRDPSLPLLLKPFTAQQLLKTVRRVLDEERH
jgi:two-component system cell cycle sensor histidine kinase/response regulator CckA